VTVPSVQDLRDTLRAAHDRVRQTTRSAAKTLKTYFDKLALLLFAFGLTGQDLHLDGYTKNCNGCGRDRGKFCLSEPRQLWSFNILVLSRTKSRRCICQTSRLFVPAPSTKIATGDPGENQPLPTQSSNSPSATTLPPSGFSARKLYPLVYAKTSFFVRASMLQCLYGD